MYPGGILSTEYEKVDLKKEDVKLFYGFSNQNGGDNSILSVDTEKDRYLEISFTLSLVDWSKEGADRFTTTDIPVKTCTQEDFG